MIRTSISYCHQNPINFTDPTGHYGEATVGAGMGVAAASANSKDWDTDSKSDKSWSEKVRSACKSISESIEKALNAAAGYGFKTSERIGCGMDKRREI